MLLSEYYIYILVKLSGELLLPLIYIYIIGSCKYMTYTHTCYAHFHCAVRSSATDNFGLLRRPARYVVYVLALCIQQLGMP